MSTGSAAGTEPTAVAVRRHNSVSDVPEALWDRLLGHGGLFTSHRYVESFEAVEPDPDSEAGVYAAEYSGEVVGLLPVWRGLPANGSRYDLHAVVHDACPPARTQDWVPFASFGTRTGYSNCVAVDPALPAHQQHEVLQALTTAALGGSRQAAWFPYLDTAGAATALTAMPDAHVLLTGADTVLPVPGGGFEGYLAALPSKHRIRVRREVRRFTDSGITTELTTLGQAWPLLSEMLARRLEKYGSSADTTRLDRIFRDYGDIFRDDALVLLAVSDGKPIAFVTLYRWRDDLYGRSWGYLIDGRNLDLYFNLAFYEPIRIASRLCAKRIHFGMLSYGAKVRRGALLEPRWSVVRPSSPPSGAFAAAVTRHNAALAAEFTDLMPSLQLSTPTA